VFVTLPAPNQLTRLQFVHGRSNKPNEKIVTPSPWVPHLFDFCKSVKDGLSAEGVFRASLRTLDIHPRIYPGKRPANLSYHDESIIPMKVAAIHAHMMGDPSTSMITDLNGRCVAKAWRARTARKPFGSSTT
jgi:hypothetical protein